MEELREKLSNGGNSVDDNTLYTCFVSALPAAEYALGIRYLDIKQVYDSKQIINTRRKRQTRDGSKTYKPV